MSVESADIVVGVVGAGAMGTGIAQVAAAAGHQVILGDLATDAVANAKTAGRTSPARQGAQGERERADAAGLLARGRRGGGLSPGLSAHSRFRIANQVVRGELRKNE